MAHLLPSLLSAFVCSFHDNGCAVNRSAWLELEANAVEAHTQKKAFDVTDTVLECRLGRDSKGWQKKRQKDHQCLWVLSTWIWWVCLCFALLEQTVQRLSDKMGSIWAYLLDRRSALSHFKMSRPDGVLFSYAPPLFFSSSSNKSIPP